MKIEVMGSGCKKCKLLYDLTKEIANELDIQEVSYSTDINKIINMGLVSSPVLTIDDKPILVGIIPSKERLREIISKNI